ncbi:MAG: PqqD family protein [Clostridia bacterium]|nr:PqqD family protein [Clostridia bacterium]
MKLKYNFVINQVAGETVAVSVGDNDGRFNGYIKLNETGAFIFKMLKKDTTREDIINALLAEYPDATQEVAAESVDELVEQLRKAELLS